MDTPLSVIRDRQLVGQIVRFAFAPKVVAAVGSGRADRKVFDSAHAKTYRRHNVARTTNSVVDLAVCGLLTIG